MPVIGFLRSSTLANATSLMAAFRQGLKETGYVEGQNVAIEYRFAENDRDKLTALVNDFIHRPVAVIVGNLVAALAAKAASTTVPIVFATGPDPVKNGMVTNLNRPGGNITGVSFLAAALGGKTTGAIASACLILVFDCCYLFLPSSVSRARHINNETIKLILWSVDYRLIWQFLRRFIPWSSLFYSTRNGMCDQSTDLFAL
jgi:hypothetical protein